ncbi:hypothetical protein [Alteromonas sp. BZK5]|jgi:hypothetical protein|uniref:hypothetical protein n=1 Tax=Alteromonas sp. BZK5 TaxID=1904459 RepID=UPI0016536001|nr:hypothetical protein [Alteromonas sp. BZK5]MBC6987809.1 hypothetical protein [Alteromonas sp. BZK5]
MATLTNWTCKMKIEYWLYHDHVQYRFNLSDIGEPVDVWIDDNDAVDKTFQFGGELGIKLVAHRLYQNAGRLGYFSGPVNWRRVGRLTEVESCIYDDNDRYLLLCYLLDNEAYVVIDEDGKPLMQLQSASLPITPCYSEGIESGVVIDMVGAKTQSKKKESNPTFSGNPPPSPYL